MTTLLLFGLQIVISLSVSGVVIALLRPVIFDIFLGACGSAPRARFWMTFTHINLVLAPLLLVMFFAPVTDATVPESTQLVRDALFRALIGVFIGIATVGHVIWKTVKTDLATAGPKPSATTPEAHV